MSATGQLLAAFLVNPWWQIPLIAASAAWCAKLMRRASSTYRHVAWIAALALCSAVPFASLRNSRVLAPLQTLFLFKRP